MVADMSPTGAGQNDSLFDFLDHFMEEVNQSNLEVAEGDPLDAEIIKVSQQTLFVDCLGPLFEIDLFL